MDGSEYVQITIAPASGVDLSGENPVETYLGPDSFIPETDTGTIAELAISEDFEGLMSWVVGLEQSAPYAHEVNVEEGELIVDFSTS